ncbi:hypothetical protein [Rheinheimera soli]|uniref:hypothetical protein n=1 Tax=Rheinheimera soli TaxID=443616 RepID=UPI001E588C46|nr:hypothetical protein [Rheinheimera soli]
MRSSAQHLKMNSPYASTDNVYLMQVVRYYHQQLVAHYQQLSAAVPLHLSLEDVKQRQWGYCDRTLGVQLPSARDSEGGAMRGALQRLGVFKANGRELFRGCIVIPVFDGNGMLLAIKGKRVATRLPSGKPRWIDWQREAVSASGGMYDQLD